MSTPVKLRLYCSICARNDFYMDRIRAVADGLGLDYTLEKITDDDVIVEFGNNKNCRIPMQKAAIAQLEKPSAE